MKKVNGVLSGVKSADIELLKSNPVEFWEGVTSIGAEAFSYCFSLSEISVPDIVTSIGSLAFLGCSALKDVVVADGVTNISNGAFSGCSNLKKVKLSEGLTAIPNSAFSDCSNLTEIIIPSGVKSIGSLAFFGCSKLENITLPKGLTTIGNTAFRSCVNLTSVEFPEGLETIGNNTFRGCSKLKDLKLPEGLTTIGNATFRGCSSLCEVSIPNSIKDIGEDAFGGLSCNDMVLRIKGKKLKNAYLISKFDKLIDDPERYVDYLDNHIPQEVVDKLFDENKINLIQNLKNYSRNIYKKYVQDNPEIDEREYAHTDLVTLCLNLGIFSKEKMNFGKDSEVMVADQGYNVLQKLFKAVNPKTIHLHFQALTPDAPNEALLRFLSNKTNLDNAIQEEQQNVGFITRMIFWFNSRRDLQLPEENGDITPGNEGNRYKVLVYEATPSGIDKLKWHEPTIENLKKEFATKKFIGIDSDNSHIAKELAKHDLYIQKHFDKACDIDDERIKSGVSDHITERPVKQTIDEAWKEYFEKTEQKKKEILDIITETTKEQGEVADRLFTYEMISKSSPANFCMGFYTSCCATLYGAGAGAQRAMIISPNMQPLVIRDFRGGIVAFGIIYVNKKEGYAVVNDIEVNKKYEAREDVRAAIYNKAISGVEAFVREYNLEQEQAREKDKNLSKKIKKVTCGISPNWKAVNDFIKKNPQSEILSAPNLGEFSYAGGSGRWPGDWHKEQYTIWEESEEGVE